ncbi:MAG: M6 family metalloprotease domain-containing protein [Bacteroidaceae bacterium]|nr:M6 family metalloprotease domain-containing protein [Bacteroidaceae bacterium]
MAVSAVPAKRERFTLTLADGSTIEATWMGDEILHFYLTDEGKYLQCDDEGIAHFIEPDILQKRWEAKANKRQAARAKRNAARKRKSQGAMIGTKRGLVILVQFPETPFHYTNATFQDFFNEEGYTDDINIGSVRDYFRDASYGQFDFTFDIVGPITMSQSLSYYGGNNSNGDDVYPATMVAEAVRMIDEEVDFSQYDWDGDGEVEQIFVIHSGHDEAQSGTNADIWSHAWTLSEALEEGDGKGPVKVDEVIIDSYATSAELRDRNGTKIAGIGTACHEFSHCFGLPDFYDTAGGNFGMNSWDLMDYGNYNGNGGTPAGFTSYERMFCGWLEPIELKEADIIQDMPALTSMPVAYILRNSGKEDEYYLLENRQQEGWDKRLSGHGLLILHVDYDRQAWEENTVNTKSQHQRMTIIPADNSPYRFSLAGDPWPGSSGKTELSDTSTPAATLYNESAEGGKFMHHALTEISESDKGLISFIFDEEALGVGTIQDLRFKPQNEVYDLSGRKWTEASRGIAIKEGKKIMTTR